MENKIENEICQNEKGKFLGSTLWMRIISIMLCIAVTASIALGAALFVSNNKNKALCDELNAATWALEEKNITAAAEIKDLQNARAEAEKELEGLAAELSEANAALEQAKAERNALKGSIEALEKTTTAEIEQLKADLSKLNTRLAETDGKIRIYIDQGHNPAPYHNNGAEGNGLYEQDVTFLIGSILADILREDGRFVVQLSRPNKSVVLGTDNKSSLMARVEGAAEFDADYLISLHTNSFGQDSANGIEVYVAEEKSESYIFGEALLGGLVDSTKLRNRGMKLNPDLDILEYSEMPAALLEMGFISNSTDAALLAEQPELFAQGIYNGILDYFGLLPNN